MTPAEILNPICSEDEYRPNITKPFAATFEGRRWVAATNGHCMAMLPGEGEEQPHAPDVAKVFEPEPPRLTHRASVALLKEWAGPAPKARVGHECDRCGGDGEVECPTCGADDYDCPDCGGEGTVYDIPDMRSGALLLGQLNRSLLALVLSTVPADVETILLGQREEHGIYYFRATNWIGVIMPLAHGRPDSKFEMLEAA